MPPSRNDMYELKLRKKLLAQQLSVVDDKVDRLMRATTKRRTMRQQQQHHSDERGEDGVGNVSLASSGRGNRSSGFQGRNPGGFGVVGAEISRKQLMTPKVIEPGSTFDHVRKRNLLRHTKAVMDRKPKPQQKPKKGNAYKVNSDVPPSLLPRRYTRGELPCSVEHRSSGLALSWMCPLHNLDYEHYLPIFMDGLRCTDNPFKFIANQAVKELIDDARGNEQIITDTVDSLILPIRYALATKEPGTVLSVITILKQLCRVHPGVGPLLIPHYRQILGILNLFYCKSGKNLGDQMEYGLKPDDLVVEIAETLELLEKTGGDTAFAAIKFMVPTYTSAFAQL